MSENYRLPAEWFKQADYDLDTAWAMFEGGRYSYTIFMCHLAIEKGLKGVYARKLETNPPKTHNLIYICELIEIEVPVAFLDFLDNLTNLSVPTRYPEELDKLLKNFQKDPTLAVFKQTQELLIWLKETEI